MPSRDDDDRFRVRPAPPKARGKIPRSKFIASVIRQTSRAGRKIGRSLPSSRPGKGARSFGRGQVAARLAGRGLSIRSRRVAVKVMPVKLKGQVRATKEHLSYLARDAATRDRQPGRLFNAFSDHVDGNEFADRGRDDRHNFRIMVSPEDGAELGDLKSYARDFMSQMEGDLGTPLEWAAAEHWDTDQPHLHIVLRGKDERGNDLVISPDYISEGMRARASEIATRWLGLRTELEIRASLQREVTQERFTSLDRSILEQAVDGVVTIRDAGETAEARFRANLTIGRLDHLGKLGLAVKSGPFEYTIAPNAEEVLRRLGERGDIVRTIQRAMGRERREFSIFDPRRAAPRLVGRIAGKGLADEMVEHSGYLIVDGSDGRAHYVRLPTNARISDYPLDGIVEVRSGAEPRRSDANIHSMTVDGLYHVDRHLEATRHELPQGSDPEAFVRSHVRRLEALRRGHVVDRLREGVWVIPPDFLARAQAFDAERTNGAAVELRSHLPLRQQINAIGATWLDQQLLGKPETGAALGFAGEVRSALSQRAQFLVEHGLAERQGPRVIFARNLLDTLRRRELEDVTKKLEVETGMTHRPVVDGIKISGTYRRSVQLASGRFAMLDDGLGFSLVPWRPVIEERMGQPMTALVRGNFISFDFGRKLGLSL